MLSRKELKKNARKNLKEHYLFFLIVMLIAMFIGSIHNAAFNIVNFRIDNDSNVGIALVKIADGDVKGAINTTTGNYITIAETGKSIANREVEVEEGVSQLKDTVWKMVDYMSKSYFATTLFSGLVSMTGSPEKAKIALVIVAFILMFFKIMLLSNVFKVVYHRFFLQGRLYKYFPGSALMHLIGLRHWGKVSLAMMRAYLFKLLWSLTIVGGVIKRYEYFMVPFILAERSDISGKDAIKMSQNMMNGHKWECFVLDISFIGWGLLNIVTFGLVSMLFSESYRMTVFAEYYVELRKIAKESGVDMMERLDDKYLYEYASKEAIDEAYADVVIAAGNQEEELPQISKFENFLAKFFGMVPLHNDYEKVYRKNLARKLSIMNYEKALEGVIYPEKTYPVKPPVKKIHLENVYFMRHYSLPSLLLMFFSFSFIGWIWEVGIHIIEDARFVNRGVLHGPWLPIYGSGAMIILLLLNRFRNKPVAEFFLAMTLCGGVEYFTSWLLEVTKDGTKWWDYSDYFLNLNGRICAEGLLIFGVAGVAGVYFLAPVLDNFFSKISTKKAVIILVILIAIFVVDNIYSSGNPNVGKGITDYAFSGTFADLPCSERILYLRNIKMG